MGTMTGEAKRVTIACPRCHTANEVTVQHGVPVTACVKCGFRVTARVTPHVVSR